MKLLWVYMYLCIYLHLQLCFWNNALNVLMSINWSSFPVSILYLHSATFWFCNYHQSHEKWKNWFYYIKFFFWHLYIITIMVYLMGCHLASSACALLVLGCGDSYIFSGSVFWIHVNCSSSKMQDIYKACASFQHLWTSLVLCNFMGFFHHHYPSWPSSLC